LKVNGERGEGCSIGKNSISNKYSKGREREGGRYERGPNLPLFLSFSFSVCLSVERSFCFSLSVERSLSLSVRLSLSLSVGLSVCLSVGLSFSLLSKPLSLRRGENGAVRVGLSGETGMGIVSGFFFCLSLSLSFSSILLLLEVGDGKGD
jgi:hypothetical protein